MIDIPDVLDVPAQKTAMIHLVIPSVDIMKHMQAGLGEIRAALAAQGVQQTGPWFTHHFKIPDQTFDFEICLPVDADIKPQGRVAPGTIRAAKVARTVYRGNYSGLPHGWGEFMAWTKAQKLDLAGDFWEVYAVGPTDSDNPDAWQTQLNCPLKA